MEVKKLTKDNYYTWTGHLSNSFYKAFKSCEFGAVQKYVKGEPEDYKQCFAEGHILENAIFYGLDKWCKDLARHWDKFHKATTKKEKEAGTGPTPYKWVTDLFDMAQTVRDDDFVMSYINQPGNVYQQVYEFEIGGVFWKAAIDIINTIQKWFADLKSTGEHFFNNFFVYDPIERRKFAKKFIDAFDYWTQICIYAEAIRQNEGEDFTPYLIPVTKTKPADVCVFDMRSNRYEFIMQSIEASIPRIVEVLEEKAEPTKCGTCEHCIKSRVNNRVFDANAFCDFSLEVM